MTRLFLGSVRDGWLLTCGALLLSCALLGGCGDDDGVDSDLGGAIGDGDAAAGDAGDPGDAGDAGVDRDAGDDASDAGNDASSEDASTGTDGSTGDCDEDHGGCDELTTCTETASGRECGECPAGYLGDGESGCVPTLTDLTASAGMLEPALQADETEYTLPVGLVTQTVTLTPTAPEDASIEIEGESVESGDSWESDVLDLGDTQIEITVSRNGQPDRVYTLTVNRSVSTRPLKASNLAIDDELSSVAISGDTLVVGAPGEDSSAMWIDGDQGDNAAEDAGAAYVFVRDGDAWSQQAYLKASNAGAGDRFGQTVAIDGDTVLVGAPAEASGAAVIGGEGADESAPGSGAVYVFVRDDTTWSQQAYLKASNTGANDAFGSSVAVFGDTAVVGAPGEDSDAMGVGGDQASDAAQDSGAAYVFVRDAAAWSQQAYLKASNTGPGDNFGAATSIHGETVAIGANLEDGGATGVGGAQDNDDATGSGAVYVYTRTDTDWTQQAYVKATNTGAYDEFGIGLALSEDTLVVGASLEDSEATSVGGSQQNDNAIDAGAVYVFVRDSGTWAPQAYLKASNAGAGDTFGYSVALFGDALVVGARLEDSSATGIDGVDDDDAQDSGAAYLFVRRGGVWTQQAYIKPPNTGEFDQFGHDVAIADETIAVVAPGEDSSSADLDDDDANESGAVYVFR